MDLSIFVPGRKVLVETRVGQSVHKGESRIVGMRDPDYLLIDMPSAGGMPLLSYQGEKCVVRTLYDGRIVGVSATLQFALNRPFLMAVLQCQGETREIRVRKQDRVGCNFGALLKPRPDSQAPLFPDKAPGSDQTEAAPLVIHAALIDLSESGCQVAVPLVDPSGEFTTPLGVVGEGDQEDCSLYQLENLVTILGREKIVDLTFDLPDPEPGHYEDVACKTRWARAGGSVYLVGFQFMETDRALRDALTRIVDYQRKFFTRPVQSE